MLKIHFLCCTLLDQLVYPRGYCTPVQATFWMLKIHFLCCTLLDQLVYPRVYCTPVQATCCMLLPPLSIPLIIMKMTFIGVQLILVGLPDTLMLLMVHC